MKFNPIIIDPDLVEILPDFVHNTIIDYLGLKKYCEQGDFENIRKICHRILGTAESYGFLQLDEIVRELQSFAREENLSQVQTTMKSLDSYMEFIAKEFDQSLVID